MFTDAERAELLSSEPGQGFGQLVQVDGVEISALSFNGFAEALNMDGTRPQLLACSADVEGATRGTPVLVAGVAYTVVTVQPDDQGFAVVVLEEVEP